MTGRFPLRGTGVLAALAAVAMMAAGCRSAQYYDSVTQYDKSLVDCEGMTPHADRVDTFLVIGHRGAAGRAVENTIPSMIAAVDEDSANAVEIDLVMTADGEVVLWHDWNPGSPISLVREQGLEPAVKYRPLFPTPQSGMRKPVNELTLAEFRAHYGYVPKDTQAPATKVDVEIPTLTEFLRWAAKRPRLRYVFLDIKAPGDDTVTARRMIETMKRTLERVGHTFRPVYMTPAKEVYDIITELVPTNNVSFDVDIPGGAVVDPCDISSSTVALQRGKGFASTVHPFTTTLLPWTTLKRLIACDVSNRDRIDESVHPSPLEKVIAATINEVEKIECLIGMGVDGLITDDPRALREIARRMGRKVY